MASLFRKRLLWKLKALCVLVLLVGVTVGYKKWVKPYLTSLQEVTIKYEREEATSTVKKVQRVVDGKEVDEDRANPALVALIVDNHADARPPAGISKASVVYEAPAEGGITRFLALYPLDSMPEKVGPVRSVRPYYLRWALEWGSPLFGHVGGSPDGLELTKTAQVNDFNEYYNGSYFWRDEKRERPHNVFTSRALIEKSGRATSTTFTGWKFEPLPSGGAVPAPAASASVKKTQATAQPPFTVLFSKPSYVVTWAYDAQADVYDRLQGGRLHRDEDGSKITAHNVIIQEVNAKIVDDVGRLNVDVQGAGVATILQHGKKIVGTWKRAVGEARTKFFDDRGKEVVFVPGTTWIEVVTPLNTINDGMEESL